MTTSLLCAGQGISFKKAKSLSKNGYYAEACNMYYSLIDAEEDREKRLLDAGLACLYCGQVEYADNFLTQLVREDNELEYLYHLAVVKHMKEDYAEAVRLYKSFLKWPQGSTI